MLPTYLRCRFPGEIGFGRTSVFFGVFLFSERFPHCSEYLGRNCYLLTHILTTYTYIYCIRIPQRHREKGTGCTTAVPATHRRRFASGLRPFKVVGHVPVLLLLCPVHRQPAVLVLNGAVGSVLDKPLDHVQLTFGGCMMQGCREISRLGREVAVMVQQHSQGGHLRCRPVNRLEPCGRSNFSRMLYTQRKRLLPSLMHFDLAMRRSGHSPCN